MSFTNGKPWTVTAQDLTKPWGGAKNAEWFRCYLCGHKFAEGDVARWVFSNSVILPNGEHAAPGNPIVCERCDGPDVLARWTTMFAEAREKFWYFTRRIS